MKVRFEETRTKLQELVTLARKVTICLDAWTKKGLSASFLGISASFFNPVSRKPCHILLSLVELTESHTGEMLSGCLERCLSEYNIPASKVLLLVTDNGANMIKAIRLLQEKEMEKDTEDGNSEGEDDEDAEDDIPLARLVFGGDSSDYIAYRRLPCMAHSLQLIVREVNKHKAYESVIVKARHLVAHIRKSPTLIDVLVKRVGKSVIMDCTTRWNSTNAMIKRLIDIKSAVNEVMSDASIDTLVASEWAKLDEVVNLLEPFAVHTDVLQSDTFSLSNVIPALMDLECHLQLFEQAKSLTKVSCLFY